VHSLVVEAAEPGDVVASAEYGERFPAIVGRGRVFGAQFHPEKSSAAGLRMLRNFVGLAAPVEAAA
jgi:glutamine amidotransferase